MKSNKGELNFEDFVSKYGKVKRIYQYLTNSWIKIQIMLK